VSQKLTVELVAAVLHQRDLMATPAHLSPGWSLETDGMKDVYGRMAEELIRTVIAEDPNLSAALGDEST
jgi:hypothetical protein